LSVFEIAFVGSPIRPSVLAGSVVQVVFELAGVFRAVVEHVFSLTVL
jgi:hypothetical protein